jgi:hypothetical protein
MFKANTVSMAAEGICKGQMVCGQQLSRVHVQIA